MITLRPVTEEDIRAVAQWPPYAGVYAQMDYALGKHGWLPEFNDKPARACFMAETGGSVVGFTLLRTTGENRMEVRIALHPERTGQGLGKAVMPAILEKGFSDPGLGRIGLMVRKNNGPAIKLYRKLGFVERGESMHTVQDRAIAFFDMDISREDFMNFRNREACR